MIKKECIYKYLFIILISFVLLLALMIFIATNNSIIIGEAQILFKKLMVLSCFILVFTSILMFFIFHFFNKNQINEKRKPENQLSFIDNISNNEINNANIDECENINLKHVLTNSIQFASIDDFAKLLLINIAKEIEVVSGIFYYLEKDSNLYKSIAFYARLEEENNFSFSIGDGLVGQVALDKTPMILSELPDDYIEVLSGLGSSKPRCLLLLPIIYQNQTIGVIEMATFKTISIQTINQFMEISEQIGQTISEINNNIAQQNNV